MKDLSIYIHIPFCDHKCIYCDFYSIINYKDVNNYLLALKKEIELQSKVYSAGRNVKSIFFGGGTPSYMEPEYIAEIINTVYNNFTVDNDCEITMETNPGTVDETKLVNFKKAGINRISIGIQSFNDDELKFLTRIHNSQLAIDTVNLAAKSGYEDISIDLIFNLPGQSKEKWLHNLKTAVNLPITHISTYSLILENGTILNKMVRDGKVTMQEPDYDAELYSATISFLEEHGLKQYEVSNFARNGYQCYHNNIYWNYNDYLGFGTSAHSFVEKRRWWNYSSLTYYLLNMNEKGIVQAGEEHLQNEDMFNEYVMLALRSSGINKNDFTKRFGDEVFTQTESVIHNHKLEEYFVLSDNLIKLNAKGYAVGDEIISVLLKETG